MEMKTSNEETGATNLSFYSRVPGMPSVLGTSGASRTCAIAMVEVGTRRYYKKKSAFIFWLIRPAVAVCLVFLQQQNSGRGET